MNDDTLTVPCVYCPRPADPLSESTYQLIVGWQKKSHTRWTGTKGGSDIIFRQTREKFAHKECVELRRNGGNPGQGSLL